ncbi:MAG: hypothetical protein O9325_15935 [Roseomonas sp.]|nr:hypothetical protein [Roseomonas sp.]
MPKSWDQKYRDAKPAHVTVLAKPFAGVGAGEKLFIASPPLLDARIRAVPAGRTLDPVALRAELARENGAAATCPTSTAIFLRIVAERALERMEADPTPFWRVIAPDSPLARKLTCGPDFIRHRRALDAHTHGRVG